MQPHRCAPAEACTLAHTKIHMHALFCGIQSNIRESCPGHAAIKVGPGLKARSPQLSKLDSKRGI